MACLSNLPQIRPKTILAWLVHNTSGFSQQNPVLQTEYEDGKFVKSNYENIQDIFRMGDYGEGITIVGLFHPIK